MKQGLARVKGITMTVMENAIKIILHNIFVDDILREREREVDSVPVLLIESNLGYALMPFYIQRTLLLVDPSERIRRA